MMRNLPRVLAVLALLAAVGTSAAPAAPPPFAFKDLVIDQPMGEGEVGKQLGCNMLDECFSYDGKITIGGVPTKVVFVMVFGEQKELGDIIVQFGPEGFEVVRDGLKAKYPGLRCTGSAVQNRMGAVFGQEECNAENKTAYMELLQRSPDKLDESRLRIMSKKRLREKEAQQRKAQGDL